MIPPTLFSPCGISKMTRKKLKISKFQNSKTKSFQSSQDERQIALFPSYETSHKKLKSPKMTRRKLKILKFQNINIKNLQSS
jgi:hypothetical protein